MPNKGKVTERTFYSTLIDVIKTKGGEGVQEVCYNSYPDIVFKIRDYNWILSVKIGENPKIIKDAFLQYLRHKEESNIAFGILLLLPDSIRDIKAEESTLRSAIDTFPVTALVDADIVKEELRDRSFPAVIDFLLDNVLAKLEKKQATYFSMKLVISLLLEQVSEMMEQINLKEKTILKIITDKELLMDLGHMKNQNAEAVAKFLSSYIFLSQVLFLRLLTTAKPGWINIIQPVTHDSLRHAFKKVLDVNYRPIYQVDVLDSIGEKYLKDTFDLIWGLEIERVRYELPGRIFHELMPHEIRKMLAAFYTRPQAAELLSKLTLRKSNEVVFDLACGSGTILTAAYRQKLVLFREEGKAGDPHKRFCEREIIGADIMPFAVHLTSANLSALNPGTTIDRTQIIQGDSLGLESGTYDAGMQYGLFPEASLGKTQKGDAYKVTIKEVDVILMNPPFTKVERGIRKYVNMVKFYPQCGGEVGLWGHFIVLADSFLKDSGMVGAVLPINILRGRESCDVRNILFGKYTPLYILKPTKNYGFSEWSEYRDILIIAIKGSPDPNHKVKFALVKKDLTKLLESDIEDISIKIKTKESLRNDENVDIDSFSIIDVKERFLNLMWFCGTTNFSNRDILVDFINKSSKKLDLFPKRYFREGYRPVPKGVSKFLFVTRNLDESRVEMAFLRFDNEKKTSITAYSPLKAKYNISLNNLTPTLRTSVGLKRMNITNNWDYIAHEPYKEYERVGRASKQNIPVPGSGFWGDLSNELKTVETHLVVSRRINPFSPSTHLNCFFSDKVISPSNQVNVITEQNETVGKAVCAILNSIIFFSNFFLLKEESTGRYIDIRFYDLEEMRIFPKKEHIAKLAAVYEKYKDIEFPSLREQFDENYDVRYAEYWEKEAGNPQLKLWNILNKPIKPFKDRLKFDIDVCKALDFPVTMEDIINIYEVLVNEMNLIRRLAKD